MASLQVRHQRGCSLGRPWTSSTADALEGCDCEATYYVVSRVDGKLVRDLAGRDRKRAEEKLQTVEVHVREDRYQPPQPIRFAVFADKWLDDLRRRSTTVDSYRGTIEVAKRAFGRKYVSKLGVADVRTVLQLVEREHRERQTSRFPKRTPREVSPTTLAKHLRQLSTCLEAAVAEGLLSANPCKRLPRSARPKVRKKRPAYFNDSELARLWPELTARPVYLALCKLAVTTGLRHGELAGLRWSDVDLLAGELHLRQQFTHGALVDRTKDAEPRVVDLVPAARTLLEGWYAETGDDGLVFENETGGYLDDSRSRKVLYAAMKRAAVDRIGERGGTRDFHSLRHTFARVALEHGAQLEWVQAQLGHSSITLTRDLYGHWSREAEKREALRLQGAFTV